MAKVYTFYVGVLAGLVLCKCSEGVWNSTEGPSANGTECHLHDNCTDTGHWNGHFSTCPEQLAVYCIHGECRYIKEMNVASCRCHPGFVGSRCEFLDFDWLKEERRHIIIIICAVVGLVLLILLVVFICIFSHRRGKLCIPKRRRRDELRNATEKLPMTSIVNHTEHTANSV
ncbi:probetacellulin [Eucyclogobius newberryi]|uniref:probetacellulin n=1 Tax=Eucyclogobius newberryi TaxID=166745 RepID=UPI003B5A4B81